MFKRQLRKYKRNIYINSLDNTWIKRTMKDMRYTFAQFKAEYPDDNACLEAVFQNRYGKLNYCPKCGADTKWYRVKNRKAYACIHCRHQLHPLADTIFRKSETSLWNWFYAIYLVSVAKNGISAKELERHLGVTYKTAWRMLNQIKKLMAEELELSGIVEADETYIGGRRSQSEMHDNKTPIVGIAEKRGLVKAKVLDGKASEARVMPFLKHNISPLSVLHTDKSRIYHNASKNQFKHR